MDLKDNEGAMALLEEHILIPADAKAPHGRFNIFPGCVSILVRSDGVKHITKISSLVVKTRSVKKLIYYHT